MIVAGTMIAGCAPKEKTEKTEKEIVPAIVMENMDTTINPADDFFRYCNNNWLKNNPIPEEYTTFGAFTEIDQHNEILIQGIIDEVSKDASAKPGSTAQKIRDFYNAGMDTVAINGRGCKELLPYFEKVDALTDKADLATLLGELHSDGFGGFFYAGGSSDPKNAEMVIMHLFQGGLSLPDRDDYLEEASQEMRDKYVEHVAKMFQLTGTDPEPAKDIAERILAFETELAKNSLTRLERRDPDRTYNKRSRAELQASTPVFNWDAYFDAAGAPAFDSLNVGMPDFVAALNGIILNTDLRTLKDYLDWKIIHGSASLLSDDFAEENFNYFSKYLYGQEVQQPRWRRVLNATSGVLGEAIGQLYVEKYFPAEYKERMLNLVGNLRTALGERIKNVDWMSDETKAKALHKLDCFNVKIGYPNKWKDYTNLEITSESYFQNFHNAIRFENALDMAKIGKPVDREEWFMMPQTVNAYYSPDMNEIVFPAAILQPPFFNMDADDAVNYGGIGVVIGHEMTHGFDDQGCQYDSRGNLSNWWTEQDASQFAERTDVLRKYFDNIEVLPGVHANGSLTLGENIADHGGLQVAFNALQKTPQAKRQVSIDGFTPAQRFFIAYAHVWAGNIREQEIMRRTNEDPHALGEYRVNGTLPHINAFAEAFNLQPGDAMYLPVEERVSIW